MIQAGWCGSKLRSLLKIFIINTYKGIQCETVVAQRLLILNGHSCNPPLGLTMFKTDLKTLQQPNQSWLSTSVATRKHL